ncbi:hypothetical protein [Massilia horti]|uniref:DNA-binding protein n=1 Tax=Massilia horti TaxID=2562153 RepID=A0A4Y9SV81_9BURK|nr:hypothetical protein [Massilia horti]TFW28656.1 hypothetical protein E4O92_20615 [Massilia horti]
MKTVPPYPAPDWDAWLHVEKIRKLDALCLSMNICPQVANEDYGIIDAMRGDEDEDSGGPRVDDIAAVITFQRRRFAMRELPNTLTLSQFLAFAKKLKWNMPPELAPEAIQAKDHPPPSSPVRGYGTAPKEVGRSDETTIKEPSNADSGETFPSIDLDTRTHVSTACAAFWLGRKPQTLLMWNCHGTGPMRPIKSGRQLMWPVDEIRKHLRLKSKKP